jgi:hypothetical protein
MSLKLFIDFFQGDRRVDRSSPRPSSQSSASVRAPQTTEPQSPSGSPAGSQITVNVRRFNDQQRAAREVLDQNRGLSEPLQSGQAMAIQTPSSLWSKLGHKRMDLGRALEATVQNAEFLAEAHQVDRDRVEDLLVEDQAR